MNSHRIDSKFSNDIFLEFNHLHIIIYYGNGYTVTSSWHFTCIFIHVLWLSLLAAGNTPWYGKQLFSPLHVSQCLSYRENISFHNFIDTVTMFARLQRVKQHYSVLPVDDEKHTQFHLNLIYLHTQMVECPVV